MPDTSARLPRATNDEIPIPSLAGLSDDRRADHARTRTAATPAPAEGATLAKVAWSRTSGVGVDDPEAVGADDADAPRAGHPQHLGLEGGAVGARLGEPGREDHHAVHLLAAALLHDGGTWSAGTATTARSTRRGCRGCSRAAAEPRHVVGVGVARAAPGPGSPARCRF